MHVCVSVAHTLGVASISMQVCVLLVSLLVCLARLEHVGASHPHDGGLVQVCV